MSIYLRFLSFMYFTGFLLHCADLFDLRLEFSGMNGVWRAWIIYLLVLDFLAAVGLWKRKPWGVALFFLISTSQLIAYLGFKSFFGEQTPLAIFHVVSQVIFISLFLKGRLRRTSV